MARVLALLRPLAPPLVPWVRDLFLRRPGWVPRDLHRIEPPVECTPEEWWISQGLLGLVVGLASGVVFEGWIYGVLAGTGAAYLPTLWIKEQVEARRRRLLAALPNFLDLLTACVEGGMTFDASVAKVVEFGVPSRLKDEFAQYLYEVNVGKSRREALKAMALRVDLKECSTVLSGVAQAEQLGTSLVEGLRVQARDIRLKWRQQMEKQALEAPVKLLFPLTLFIFPTTFIVIFGPFVIRFMENF